MALTLTLPQPGKQSTTKDYVITILGYDWPLSIKKIFNISKKRYAHKVTYQAVFKAVNELLEDGVIDRKEDGYQINMEWLKQIHRYTESVETNYYTKNRLALIEGIKDARKEGNINVLTFETFFDVEKYLYYLQKHYILSAKGKEAVCVHHAHEWRPLFYLRAEYNWMRSLRKAGHCTFILCAGNTLVDKWCADFYRASECKVKLGANCASPCEMIVFGDIVIQVYLPSIIKEGMDRAFTKVEDLRKLNTKLLVEQVLEKKTEIKVMINKDPDLAEQIRKDTMRHFPV